MRKRRVKGKLRNYYCTKRDDDKLLIVVTHDGLEIETITDRVVDATLGNDHGEAGFVHLTSRLHWKVTVWRVVSAAPDLTLSEQLSAAPNRVLNSQQEMK